MSQNKCIPVFGVYFQLIVKNGKPNHYFDENKKEIVISTYNIASGLDEALFYFYKSVFYEKVQPILSEWKNKIKRASYNKFDIVKTKDIIIQLKHNDVEQSPIQTTEKCACGSTMVMKVNSRSAAKFLACPKCRATRNLQYNKTKEKGGIILKINPINLCSKPLNEIDCIIVRNLVQTYQKYKSIEYWKEILTIYPNYFYVMKIQSLDPNLKAALDEIIANANSEEEKNKYLSVKEQIMQILEGKDNEEK